MRICQTPKVETPPGATEAEFHEAARENVRLRRLEREYWNVVDGGVEEAEVRGERGEERKGGKGGRQGGRGGRAACLLTPSLVWSWR